jgi:thiamine pyrophosphate-dependent acetolactate synthase large subunit-like protein
MKDKKTGKEAIIEQFLADGITHMFGNPGTVEQGFLDALKDYPAMKYVLTLQESIAVMMADGYARATHKPALVQLHSSPGIGNAVGALYQAKRGHAPLVVIGGDAGMKYMNMDAQMANDLVAMMEPVTKYSTVVMDSRSLLRTLRRAIKIATTPPMGPVYICLPMDILDEINEEAIFPTCTPSSRVTPAPEIIEEAAQKLINAEKPMIFVGDGIAYSQATEELEHVAEILGAEVYEVEAGDFNMNAEHPLYRGSTGHMFGSHSLPITQKGDAILVVGTYMMPEVFPMLSDIYSSDAYVIHFDLNGYEIAKNHRVDLGVISDPKMSLAALGKELERLRSAEQATKAQQRSNFFATQKDEELATNKASDLQYASSNPIHMGIFAEMLAKKVPDDVIIFDEALTNSPALQRYLPPKRPYSYFTTRGGSLGVGIPGALGAKMAHPDKTVIGFSGDGGSMYTIQALWSAARHNVGAKFVICNNGSYRLLQLNIDAYWGEQDIAKHAHPLCFDLSSPAIQFDALARSMGIEALTVKKPHEIEPAIERMLSDDKPFLLNLLLEGDVHPELIGVKCGQ